MKTTSDQKQPLNQREDKPLVLVETAFLASTASLIWFINYYFPFVHKFILSTLSLVKGFLELFYLFAYKYF